MFDCVLYAVFRWDTSCVQELQTGRHAGVEEKAGGDEDCCWGTRLLCQVPHQWESQCFQYLLILCWIKPLLVHSSLCPGNTRHISHLSLSAADGPSAERQQLQTTHSASVSHPLPVSQGPGQVQEVRANTKHMLVTMQTFQAGSITILT